MEDKNKWKTGQNASILVKKTWAKPDIEIIGHDNVQSGQAGGLAEGTFTGFLPYSLYNS